MDYKQLPVNRIFLVVATDDGRISQLGMTEDQSIALQAFVASMSKTKPLVKMNNNHDLVLKSDVKKLKRKK